MIGTFLELSTAHIKPDTDKYLSEAVTDETDGIPVFEKTNGYYIPVNEFMRDEYPDMPEDLKTVIDYALDKNCSLLILDGEGDVEPDLTTYDGLW